MVAVLAAGGLALHAGRISAGDLFAATQYAVLGAGLGGLTGMFGRLARARAGANRADEVLRVDPVGYGQRSLPDGPGRLEFRKVTARAGDAVLLDGVDLALPGGAAVAVIGPSGAGKSVLAALAARLRDPDDGQVLLDGIPLAELSHEALRGAVCCAFERPVLVGATVADATGPELDLDLVRTAAKATHAHEFVCRLPQGYHTPLAEAPMSGGEAQRLGLTRAWQAERLLVLDDATSSLDMVTEMQISHTLTGDHGGRTRLIVTHRVTTAARADLVVWLEGGRVRAVGPHDQLWDEPAYRKVFG
jgi:ATP-binding cassette subfamily B protein